MRQLKIQKSITNRNSEALDKYLVEIGRAPMVSIEEEIELAQAIKKGGRAGERAKNKLVEANLRFVVSVAKQYQHQGLTLTDLIDEGNIGLIKAAERFDETRGFKFSGHHVSIDAPFGDDDDNAMVDVMSSGDDSRTDKQVDHESMAMELKQVLGQVLKERERQIVCACFGIGEPEKGLEEIGDKMGLTRERVRQIREKSISKLRESGYVKILMKYLG